MEEVAPERPLFRPVKRRKVFRKRIDEHAEAEPISAASPHDVGTGRAKSNSNDLSDAETTASEFIRIRRQQKSYGHGIAFSSSSKSAVDQSDNSTSLEAGGEIVRPRGIEDRFVGHSDQVVDVDKHMLVFPIIDFRIPEVTGTNDLRIAFIESELARRNNEHSQSLDTRQSKRETQSQQNLPGSKLPERQAASLGKLQEIDLGQDATLRNLERTEAAVRRQNGEEVIADEPIVPKKPRLGRNGKPRRGPKRRNSDDIKRDQLVEELLRENRLDINNDAVNTRNQPEAEAGDGDADERLAEKFREEFYAAAQARHRTSRNVGPPKAATNAPKDILKGPKLGGSRSARAAMHRHLEAEAKKR